MAVILLGMAAFITGSPLQLMVMEKASAAPSLASSANQAAFNLANAGGAWIGGLALAAGFGVTSPALAGAALAVLGLAVAALAFAVDRRRASGRRPRADGREPRPAGGGSGAPLTVTGGPRPVGSPPAGRRRVYRGAPRRAATTAELVGVVRTSAASSSGWVR